MKTVTTIKASELTVGVVGVEGDGCLVDILDVVKTTPKTITVRLLARNSMAWVVFMVILLSTSHANTRTFAVLRNVCSTG
jgi:hypothetical protein